MQQLVAISRAMAIKAKVLILDEPTSSLDAAEVEGLFTVMRTLRDQGVAILFVSHFLDQIYAISDRLTVLRNGKYEGEYLTRDLDRHALISRMIGKDLDTLKSLGGNRRTTPRDARRGDLPLGIRHLPRRRRARHRPRHPARRGRRLRRTPRLRAHRARASALRCGPQRVRPDHRQGAQGRPLVAVRRLAQRIAFSTENRRDEGIIGDLTIRENMILAVQAKRGWARPMPRKEQDAIVDKYIAALNVRPPDPERMIKNLSGGNQQESAPRDAGSRRSRSC